MRRDEWKIDRRTLAALAAALVLGIGAHDLFAVWPSILTEFISPVNESIWEHVKLIFWPLLFVEFAFFPKAHRASGLTAILLCSVGLLLLGWTYHVVLGGTLMGIDLLIFVGMMVGYIFFSAYVRVPRGVVSGLAGLYILAIGLILAFTITPPHGTLFNDPALAGAWVIMNC